MQHKKNMVVDFVHNTLALHNIQLILSYLYLEVWKGMVVDFVWYHVSWIAVPDNWARRLALAMSMYSY